MPRGRAQGGDWLGECLGKCMPPARHLQSLSCLALDECKCAEGSRSVVALRGGACVRLWETVRGAGVLALHAIFAKLCKMRADDVCEFCGAPQGSGVQPESCAVMVGAGHV